MTDFFRFPHTPHLAWLGKVKPRDDKVMSSCEAQQFLNKEVTLEEKVDGANLGISVDADGMLRIQNRGAYIDLDSPGGQFKPLKRWISSRIAHLEDALFPNLILFGEWCYAVHSVLYTRLPDWFLAFDVYDRDKSEFWSAEQRNALASALELSVVPRVDSGRFSLSELEKRLGQSQITESPAEGLYLRHDEGTRLVARAKLVRPEFTQSIAEHWSKRDLKANLLVADSASANWRR